jgi:hypothetical protein
MVTSLKVALELPLMSSLHLKDTMRSLFQPHLALSESRIERVACATVGMLLAGTSELPKVARWLPQDTQQDSRVKFLSRLLDAPYLTQEAVYHPLLVQALRRYTDPVWHMAMDRSSIGDDMDLLAVTLSFRKRSIPLVWQVINFGCTGADEQVTLLKRVLPLIPSHQAVVFHGDTEFGSVKMMQAVRQHDWDFILGQPANTYFRRPGQTWEPLSGLKVTARHAVYIPQVEWTQEHRYGPLNIFAFYAPHQNAPFSPRRDIRYCTTTLPITHTLRRQGRRRWGIEPFFRDYKSSGWEIESSALCDPARMDRLLTLLSINYLWSTCLGRWLCKTGRRHEIDANPRRQLSLFRLGYDWLIHQHVVGLDWPLLLALYA